jgi:hypothetical protein
MAIRNEFLCRNAQAIRFGNLDLAPSACTLASRLLPNSPLIFNADAHRGDGKRLIVGADQKLKTSSLRPNDPNSATAATEHADCNSDAMPPFAAAHG